MPFSTDYALYPAQFIEGQIVDSFPHDIITLANSAGQVKQVDTITIGTVANATVYTYSALGQTVSYTSDADATAAEVTTGLLNAIRANSVLFGRLIPVSPGAGTITLTARYAGTANSFTSSVTGTGATVATTTPAAEPAVLPFGRAVATLSTDGSGSGRLINAAPSTTNIIRGVSIRTNVAESIGIGASIVEGYAPRDAINVMRRGRCAVRVIDAVTPLSQVFVQHTGTLAGQFRGSANASATALTAAAGTFAGGISFASNAPAGGLAILNINIP